MRRVWATVINSVYDLPERLQGTVTVPEPGIVEWWVLPMWLFSSAPRL